jgi:hypothetical protein
MVEKLKLALKGFEGISGLKINYAKYEIVPLNINFSEVQHLANILRCKIKKLPMKCLWLPLHWKKLFTQD